MIGDWSEDGMLELSGGRCIPVGCKSSVKASRLRLTFNNAGELCLTIPVYSKNEEIDRFLRQSIPWIERMLNRWESHPEKQKINQVWYPTVFHFPVTEQNLSIRYEWHDVCWAGVREEQDMLLVSGRILDPETVQEALIRYLIRKAESVFDFRLRLLAHQYGFSFNRLSVRFQKGRWGSCSSKGTVSLNAKMLFFPKHALRYVLIHELCHTREMNHSAKFWHEVEKYCPDYRRIRDEIRQGYPDLWP